MEILMQDYRNDELDYSKLIGNFFLIIADNGKVKFLSDRIGQYGVYCCKKAGMVSSSFIALLTAAAKQGKLVIDRNIATETLLTGNVVGSRTIVDGIDRYFPYLKVNIPGMKPLHSWPTTIEVEDKKNSGFDDLINMQLVEFDDHFKAYDKVLSRYGTVSGLTGGLDSRLLYLLLKKRTDKISLFTNTYNPESLDSKCATQFAEAAGEKFKCFLSRKAESMDSTEYKEMITDGFFFWDGVCRVHHLWLEERKNRSYLKRVYGNYRMSFSGVAGEKYRNHDGLTSKFYGIDKWIKHELLFYSTGNIFTSKTAEDVFYEYYKQKVKDQLGERSTGNRISFNAIRFFYDTVYNTTNRTQRNNIENQLIFFLSPFVEPGSLAVPRSSLGRHMEFELDLIRKLGPGLKHCNLSYGFNLNEKPGLKVRLLPALKTNATISAFHSARNLLVKRNGTYFNRMLKSHPFLQGYRDRVENLKLPIDLKALSLNDSLSPMILQMGMFLSEMESCIEIS
ncbi:MAG: hypothetical protein KAS73_12360 [Candidatus Sabulitectum sp.]|nr:hypothetical protein [Candidatus Sabulitectum sp.]